MLAVQVDYWKQQEQVRHDFETEQNERNKLAEQIRAAKANLEEQVRANNEIIRHNMATEDLQRRQREIEATQAEIARLNAESSRIAAEAQAANARSNALQAQASNMQAQAAMQNARTNQYSAKVQAVDLSEKRSETQRHNREQEDLYMREIQTSRENANRQAQARENGSVAGILGTALSAVSNLFFGIATR